MAYDAVGGGPDGAPRARGRRPVTDYGATVLNWLHNWRPSWQGGYGGYGAEMERASPNYIIKMLPPSARVARGADSVPNKHLHASLNKAKHPINVVRWTPEGRRLLTASTSGEFTLWNGTGFNFETIMQAHDAAVRAAQWSHSADWLVSADHDGFVKYWQPNFNNVQSIQAHDQPIRDLAFSPNDAKFVTASDDSTLKLFDFAAGLEEATLTGHGWDVKSADWHPTRSLIASGSKDHLVKLWDPREGGRCLATLHGHKNTITKVQFEPVRGMCLATAARDQVARVLDLRMMRDIALLRGNDKDISTLAFHPIHPMLLTTGGQHGAILHYLLDEQHPPEGQAATLAVYDSPDPATAPAQTVWPAHRVPFAHEMAVWTLDWHPTGHILASGSNDRITRFWTRARPGDRSWLTDRYHVGGEADGGGGGGRDRRGGPGSAPYGDRARARMEEEQQEMEDETDALVDQNREAQTRAQAAAAAAVPGLAALPGLHLPSFSGGIPGLPLHGGAPPPPSRLPLNLHSSGPSSSAAAIPGVGSGPGPLGASDAEGANRPPPPPPFLLFPPPGLDPSHPPPDIAEIAAMIKRAGIKLPPPGSLPPGILPPPPPPLPGMAGGGFQVPGLGGAMASTTTAPTAPAGLAFGESASSSSPSGDPISSGVRRRGPLPTQEESLRMEQSKGKYTRPR